MQKIGSVTRFLNKIRSTFSHRALKSTMEGYVITDSGKKRPIATPTKDSPNKKFFCGLSPEELAYITTPSDRPFRVSVEGNIGAGKSTLIKYFSNFAGIETYPEPINWWRDVNGHNLLELLYSDMDKWHNTFQTYVQLTRLKVQTTAPKSSTTVQLFERSIQNNRFCFLEQAFASGYLHGANYAIIDQWYKWVRNNVDITLDLIVYLRSTPEIVYQRMRERGRPEESGVKLEYLKELHESHEKWLMSEDPKLNTTPVLVLDADNTLEEILELYKANENRILGNEKKSRVVEQSEKDKVKRVLNLD